MVNLSTKQNTATKFCTITASAAAIVMPITDKAHVQPCVNQAIAFKEWLNNNEFTGCYDSHVNAVDSVGGSCSQEALNTYCLNRESCFDLCGFKVWIGADQHLARLALAAR